jgi:hypothetical protein
VQLIENFAWRGGMSLRWFQETMSDSIFGEAIFSYSRKQAIADGVLVDLSQFVEIKQLWKHHMACTDTVWAIIEDAVRDAGNDLAGILWDISHMAMAAARVRGADVDIIFFKVIIGRTTHQLKLHVGPGDDGEPVLTLMLPRED